MYASCGRMTEACSLQVPGEVDCLRYQKRGMGKAKHVKPRSLRMLMPCVPWPCHCYVCRSSVDQTENLREARPSFAFAPRHEPALSDQLPKLPYSVARASEPGARRQSMVLRPSTLQGALSRSTATTAHSACTSPLPRLDLGVRDDKKSGNDEISLAPRSEQIDALRPTKSRGGLLCKDDDVLRSSPLLESLVASWDGRRVSPGRSSLPSAVTRGISADMPKLQLPTSAPADDAP